MADFEDYYEILQVHFLAEPEVIDKAFTTLAKKYHPDMNKRADANAVMQRIIKAHDVLKDTAKRKAYDAEWIKRKQAAKPNSDKPKPTVEPDAIRFVDVKPKEIQRASFLILNAGGSYKKIWFSDPNSWIKIATYYSLTAADELPLKVEIEAAGEDWDRDYVEVIKVKLDDEETQVRIELTTQKTPNRPQPIPKQKTAKHSSSIWLKLIIGLAVVAIVAVTITKVNMPSNVATPLPAPAPIPAPAPTPSPTPPSPTPIPEKPMIKTVPLSIANFPNNISDLSGGTHSFKGIGFNIDKFFMTQYGLAPLPAEGVLDVDIRHPQKVYILINSTDTYPIFLNKQVGKISLLFDNGYTEETNLVVGQNIREYTTNTVTVKTVIDDTNQPAWYSANSPFVIDMLTIPISAGNQGRSLKKIIFTDTSKSTTNSADPGLIIWGLTVGYSE